MTLATPQIGQEKHACSACLNCGEPITVVIDWRNHPIGRIAPNAPEPGWTHDRTGRKPCAEENSESAGSIA